MSYKSAYDENHVSFEIAEIVWEEDYVRLVGPENAPEVDEERLEELAGTGLQDQVRDLQQDRVDDFEDLVSSIQFKYEAPEIAVDTSGRFSKHEIIGGSTVRQKIGEDPITASISGVCTESTARRLDNLRNAKYGTIYSNRLPNGSLQVQFASTSTQPMDSSGAVAISDNDAEFLYSYDLSVVEVVV